MARPKLGESETERLHLKITSDELKAIDDWRFANRVQSRSEAIRRLCQIGLLASETTLIVHAGLSDVFERSRILHNDLAKAVTKDRAAGENVDRYLELTGSTIKLNETIEITKLLSSALAVKILDFENGPSLEDGLAASERWQHEARQQLRKIKKKHARRRHE